MSDIILGVVVLTVFIGALAAVRLFKISSSQLLPGAPGPSQRAPGWGYQPGSGIKCGIEQMRIGLTQPEIERIRMLLLCQAPTVPEWGKIDAAIVDKIELQLQKLRQAAFDATEALRQHGEHY